KRHAMSASGTSAATNTTLLPSARRLSGRPAPNTRPPTTCSLTTPSLTTRSLTTQYRHPGICLASRSKIPPQVHSRVQVRHLIRVPVEHERFLTSKLADAALARLRPARMIHRRIDVRVEAIFVRRRDLPRVQRLFVDERDPRDRLDALEAVLPRHDQPEGCAILVRQHLSI